MAYDELSDAAIAVHDRQRELPPEARDALFHGLAAHLRGRDPCLDAGIGTGSIALPLRERGVSLVGVDISRAMLAALRAKCGGQEPFPIVRGDLTRLPFADSMFEAVLAASVFHLIPAWRVALDELLRVVRPGGLLLVSLGSTGSAPETTRLVMQRFYAMLGESATIPIGPQDEAEFHEAMVARGAVAMPPLKVQFRRVDSLGGAIDWQEHNVFARPSSITQDQASRAAASVRKWAQDEFGSLDTMQESERTITFHIYQTP
jgi:SAM-dependent methyltransferase